MHVVTGYFMASLSAPASYINVKNIRKMSLNLSKTDMSTLFFQIIVEIILILESNLKSLYNTHFSKNLALS